MFLTSYSLISLWLLSAASGIGIIYSYFNFRAKEKRLPFATEFADLEKRCSLKKEEIERLQRGLTGFEEKKAEQEQYIADVERARKRIDFDRQELQKLEGEGAYKKSYDKAFSS